MGLLGGLALAWILIRVINRQSFGWTIQISWPLGLMAEVVRLGLGGLAPGRTVAGPVGLQATAGRRIAL